MSRIHVGKEMLRQDAWRDAQYGELLKGLAEV
jgi:hypothetical protein